MRLVIQIPCKDEARSLPDVLASIPRRIPGVTSIETLVIDDGSRDDTGEVGRRHGATRVVRLPVNRGLAAAFQAGLREALRLGADVIVNTDGDCQYRGEDIAALVAPVVAGKASIVIGARDFDAIGDFTPLKRRLSRIGSRVAGLLSGVRVPDATSGLRAFSRDAAARVELRSTFTHTLETLFIAARWNLPVRRVLVGVNPARRQSRLAPSMARYVWRQGWSLARLFFFYRPAAACGALSTLLVTLALAVAAGWRALGLAGPPQSASLAPPALLVAPLLTLAAASALWGLTAWVLDLRRRREEVSRFLRRFAGGAGGAARRPALCRHHESPSTIPASAALRRSGRAARPDRGRDTRRVRG